MSLNAENGEYNLEDSINVNRVENSIIENKKIKNIIDLDNKEYSIDNTEDIKNLLENISNIIKNKISVDINKFTNMTYNDKKLDEFYKKLENLSKNKGTYKDILEIASNIEKIEKEKDNISDNEIEETIFYLKKVLDIFSNFQYILESRYFNYEN